MVARSLTVSFALRPTLAALPLASTGFRCIFNCRRAEAHKPANGSYMALSPTKWISALGRQPSLTAAALNRSGFKLPAAAPNPAPTPAPHKSTAQSDPRC